MNTTEMKMLIWIQGKNKKRSHQKCYHPRKDTHKANIIYFPREEMTVTGWSCAAERWWQRCKVCAKYSNRWIPKTQAEVNGPFKRQHEEKHTPIMGLRQREPVKNDTKRPGNDGKMRNARNAVWPWWPCRAGRSGHPRQRRHRWAANPPHPSSPQYVYASLRPLGSYLAVSSFLGTRYSSLPVPPRQVLF